MSRAGGALIAIGVLYPLLGGLSLWVSFVPSLAEWVVLGFVVPPAAVAGAVLAKLAGARLGWGGVAAFALWVVLVGWLFHSVIVAAWASI
jgi:hypothetical protein